MKPTVQFTEPKNRGDAIARRFAKASAYPKIDYSYHANSLPNLSSRSFEKHGVPFRAISDEYFKKEARHGFVSEAVVFGVIAMTAAAPLVYAASAVLHLVRAI